MKIHSNTSWNEEIDNVHDSMKVETKLASNEPAVALLVTKLFIAFKHLVRDLRVYQTITGVMESSDPFSFENNRNVKDENNTEEIEKYHTDRIVDNKENHILFILFQHWDRSEIIFVAQIIFH